MHCPFERAMMRGHQHWLQLLLRASGSLGAMHWMTHWLTWQVAFLIPYPAALLAAKVAYNLHICLS
jgi:hypothetical protein